MALADLAANLTKKALVIADSFLVDVVIEQHTQSGYDVATDSPTETITNHTLRGLLYNISDYEKTTLYPKFPEVGQEKRKLLVAKNDIIPGYKPSINDSVRIDTETWEIWRVTTPPSEPMYVMYIAKAT